ncbi:hypothetical protein WMW72_17460 [Paenibacillus filicis]|uniref:Uncharacterized protein n=1 Tax=Paenibacillus filicis TaxID=669464 RepID=A0ABU9DLG9_9BACL
MSSQVDFLFRLAYALELSPPNQARTDGFEPILQALKNRNIRYDQDKELLVFTSADDMEEARQLAEAYEASAEELKLLRLPRSLRTRATFTDFGFVSRLEGICYLYAELAVLFRLQEASEEPVRPVRSFNPASAVAQLGEHMLGDWRDADGSPVFALEAQHDELAEGIARAYGCRVEWLYRP